MQYIRACSSLWCYFGNISPHFNRTNYFKDKSKRLIGADLKKILFLKFQTFSPRAPPRELGSKPDSPFGPTTPRSPFSPLSPRSPFCPFGPTGPKNKRQRTEGHEYPREKILSEMINVRPLTIPNNDQDISPPSHTVHGSNLLEAFEAEHTYPTPAYTAIRKFIFQKELN